VISLLVATLMLLGGTLMLLAAVGIARMPDLFTRMQAATKGSSLGAGCMLIAVAIHFQDLGITMRALMIVVFIFLTAPVSAHMIARAAYFVGVPLWERTARDELRDCYDRQSHALEREPPSGARPAA
jgi:multicomponent Na+:H+ antiporter subunit G